MSSACGNNLLAISRPSQSSMSTLQCAGTCAADDLGHADPLNKSELGPRPKRTQIRAQLRDYILNMLGAPAIKLELDEQNIDFAVDQALMIFEDYAGREYFSYHVFNTTPGVSVYKMPPDVGLIRNVFYKEMGNFAFQASDLDGAIPIGILLPRWELCFYPRWSYRSYSTNLGSHGRMGFV